MIAAGDTEVSITIDIADDLLFEDPEAFIIELTGLTGATFSDGSTNSNLIEVIDSDDVDPTLPNLTGNSFVGNAADDQQFYFAGLNTFEGQNGSDYFVGGIQADELDGGAGNDVIRGEAGSGFLGSADLITGGTGDDVLMGAKGADTFIFAPGDGNDIIGGFDAPDVFFNPITGYSASPTRADFLSGVDHIQLSGFTTVDAASVMSAVTDGASGAVFDAEGTTITFFGVSAAQLASSDFMFV